jgi:hypothetical protein
VLLRTHFAVFSDASTSSASAFYGSGHQFPWLGPASSGGSLETTNFQNCPQSRRHQPFIALKLQLTPPVERRQIMPVRTWCDAYEAAIRETNPSKLFSRIVDALLMIGARNKDDAGMDEFERRAIKCARYQLRTMETQRLIDRLNESAWANSRYSQLIH